MILSESRGFIFIKGRKVASTSVEAALAGICGPGDIVTPITPIDEAARLASGGGARNYSRDPAAEAAYLADLAATPPERLGEVRQPKGRFYNHMSLREVVWKTGWSALKLPVVCVERHPYSKILSWANMSLSFSAYRAGGEMRAGEDETRDFIRRAIEKGSIRTVRNIGLYRRPDWSIRVKLLRYETLADDFDGFMRSIGVEAPPALPHAKKGRMAEPEALARFLTRSELDRVNRLFRSEFKVFEYQAL